MDRILSVEDVARILGKSPSWVYLTVGNGHLPHFRLPGGHIRFRAQSLEDWIIAREESLAAATGGEFVNAG